MHRAAARAPPRARRASSRSRTPWASVVRDLAAQELDGEAHARGLALEQQSLPAVAACAARRCGSPAAANRSPSSRPETISRGGRSGRQASSCERRELQVREPQVDALRQLVVERVALPDLDRRSRCARRSRAPPRPPSGSSSQASTGACPSRAAASASTPEPQPRSSSGPGGWPSSSSRQSSVVACEPVPKARPGIDHDRRQARRRRPPRAARPRAARATVRPVWKARQPSSQPSATGSSLHVARDLGQRARAIGAVDGQLEPAAGARGAPRRRSANVSSSAARAISSASSPRAHASTSRITRRPAATARAGPRASVRDARSCARPRARWKRSTTLALLVVERARHQHVRDQPQIAARAAAQARHAVALEHEHGAGLQARLDLDLLLAVERLDRARGAEHGLRERQVELADEIEPVAHEALVGPHVHAHVEVAGGRAELAGVAVARDAHGLAVVDARRDVDAELAPLRPPAAAAAVGAGLLRDPPAPAARRGTASCARAGRAASARSAAPARRRRTRRRCAPARPGAAPSPSQTSHVRHELEVEIDVRRRSRASASSMSTAVCASAPASGPVERAEAAAEERAEQVVEERPGP